MRFDNINNLLLGTFMVTYFYIRKVPQQHIFLKKTFKATWPEQIKKLISKKNVCSFSAHHTIEFFIVVVRRARYSITVSFNMVQVARIKVVLTTRSWWWLLWH